MNGSYVVEPARLSAVSHGHIVHAGIASASASNQCLPLKRLSKLTSLAPPPLEVVREGWKLKNWRPGSLAHVTPPWNPRTSRHRPAPPRNAPRGRWAALPLTVPLPSDASRGPHRSGPLGWLVRDKTGPGDPAASLIPRRIGLGRRESVLFLGGKSFFYRDWEWWRTRAGRQARCQT
jgi:hypothetical protein